MKKTLLLSFFLPPQKGGIENYLENLSLNVPPDKIVWLAEPQVGDSEYDRRQSFKIIRQTYQNWLRVFKLTSLSLYLKVKKIIKSENIEYLMCGHIFPLALTAMMIKKKLKIPFLIFTHGREIFEIEKQYRYKKFFPKIIREADQIVVTTDFMKNYLAKKGALENKIIKVPPGVDTNFFQPGLDVENLKQEYHLKNRKVLLTVGRLVERKGHLQVLRALPGVLQKFPNLCYLIVGDGPMKNKIIVEAKRLKIKDKIIFAGEVSNKKLPYFYNLADIFIMTSQFLKSKGDVEGFGLVYLEAAACGKPTIAGSSGGEKEAILDEQTGLAVNADNALEISHAILKLLNNEGLAKTFGENGRKRVENEFNWKNITNKLISNILE